VLCKGRIHVQFQVCELDAVKNAATLLINKVNRELLDKVVRQFGTWRRGGGGGCLNKNCTPCRKNIWKFQNHFSVTLTVKNVDAMKPGN
jgi:hypothetical protein